jgi:hypothetical protein
VSLTCFFVGGAAALRGVVHHVLLGQIEKLASSCLTSVHLVESDGHQHEGAYRDL